MVLLHESFFQIDGSINAWSPRSRLVCLALPVHSIPCFVFRNSVLGFTDIMRIMIVMIIKMMVIEIETIFLKIQGIGMTKS